MTKLQIWAGKSVYYENDEIMTILGATLVCDLMRSQFSTLYHRTQYQVMTLVKGDELPCE